eukprot:gene6743-7837_t
MVANAELGGKRTLVVLDDMSIKQTHSIFFKSLTDKGYVLDFKHADDKLSLEKYGTPLYDQLILFAPTSDDLSLTPNNIISFIDSGSNVLIAGASTVSDTIRDVASECGIEIEDDKTNVFDHLNFDKSSEQHNLIVADHFIKDSPIILNGADTTPILFRGIAHTVRSNPLNFAILTGATTAYSGRVASGSATKLMGKRVGLVSSLQARNNARVTFSGSLELFSDKFANANINSDLHKSAKAGNQQFVQNLVSWTFQERGILRSSNLVISMGNDTKPAVLTIKDEINYSIKIEQFVNGQWVPYVDQLELELIMLDPYIRTFIKGTSTGVYSADILLADVYGVFTFKASINKPGYGNMVDIVRHPIRPYRHDSYERFIPSAYPYYAACFSMIGGVFVFSIVFLLHQDPKRVL